MEAIYWNQKSLTSLENAFNQAFFKIFNTYDKQVVLQCQFYMGYLPLRLVIDHRKLTFLKKTIEQSDHPLFANNKLIYEQFSPICKKYSLDENLSKRSMKSKLWNHFSSLIKGK